MAQFRITFHFTSDSTTPTNMADEKEENKQIALMAEEDPSCSAEEMKIPRVWDICTFDTDVQTESPVHSSQRMLFVINYMHV